MVEEMEKSVKEVGANNERKGQSLRVLSSVESIESILDSMWRDPRYDEMSPEEYYERVYYGLVYSRMIIISFIGSSIAKYLDSEGLYKISSSLERISRNLAFRDTNSQVWTPPTSGDEWREFTTGVAKFFSRLEDYLDVLDSMDLSGVKVRDQKRYEESLAIAKTYVASARSSVRKGEAPLSKVAALTRRTAKLFRLIRDGLFPYYELRLS